jgi:hypothetical protein
MTLTEIALIVGAFATLITAMGGVLINFHRLDELTDRVEQEKQKSEQAQVQAEQLKREIAEVKRTAQMRDEIARTNIILLGESMGLVRGDCASLAMLVNQLFKEFERETGHRPPVDIEMLKHMRTIEYITGPLGPFEIPEQR